MEASMLLEPQSHRTAPAPPPLGTMSSVSYEESSGVLWLTVPESSSRAFDRFTKGMRDLPSPDCDPSAWLRPGLAVLEQAAPLLARSLRCASFLGCPVIVVRGLRAGGRLPRTPYDGVVDRAVSRQAIINLHATLATLGLHPVAFARENASTLHAVCPVMGADGRASSHGFDMALPFHTDYADRPIDETVRDQSPAAQVLAFAVERAEPDVPMQFVATRRLISALSPEQIRIGRAAEFAVRAPDIFGDRQARHIRRLFPRGCEHDPRCRLNLGTMTGTTSRATRLLNEIREILAADVMVERIDVRRGDIVVMDNQRAIHRRAAFAPRWDGADRYFIRVSAVRDPSAGIAADPRRPWIWS
jgi:hypothetical protein